MSWLCHNLDVVISLRFFVDIVDLEIYFDSAAWVTGAGRLYHDVWSFYPLAANLFFGVARCIALPFGGSLLAFASVWAVVMFAFYTYMVRLAVTDPRRTDLLGVLIWLAPGPIYFAFWRFDVLPAIATFLALRAARDDRLFTGALWLGVAVAFKGYALVLLPAYCVYTLLRRNRTTGAIVGILGVAPFIISLMVVFAFAGYHGVRMPFLFHVHRGLNGESTYEAIALLAGVRLPEMLWGYSRVGTYLQLACALAAAALRPKTFEELVRALLIALVGFITFSTFYSPQWVLWIVPIAYFSERRAIRQLTVAYGWLTYLNFPVSFEYIERWPVLHTSGIIALGLMRIALITFATTSRTRTAYIG